MAGSDARLSDEAKTFRRKFVAHAISPNYDISAAQPGILYIMIYNIYEI